jgi:glycerate kinase
MSPLHRPTVPTPATQCVLVAPDKFKGTLTATQAAAAIAEGWHAARPGDPIELRPMSDGGDGFGELLGRQLGAEKQRVCTVDAAHRPVTASWWWEPHRRLAIIETARVIGLAMLPSGKFHPFDLDTFGLGAVLREAAKRGPRRCLIGIGGSATNDAGFGLARALGWRFLDAAGAEITNWPALLRLAHVVKPPGTPRLGWLVVAVDVRNRLLGTRGATHIYGPQKGIRPEDIAPAERALRRLVQVVRRQCRFRADPAQAAGAGAAGGLGFGLRVFTGARLESGFGIFARETRLARRVRAADLVITGEGALDRTTVAMGKGVGELARLCRQLGVPCVGLGGAVNDGERVRRAFTAVAGIAPELTDLEAAKADAGRWLRELARRTALAWK